MSILLYDMPMDDGLIFDEDNDDLLESELDPESDDKQDLGSDTPNVIKDRERIFHSLDMIHPSISETLRTIIDFKSNYNEFYCFNVGTKLIDIYNSIFENYKYHKNNISESSSEDYKNLVNNNHAYLEMIEECLYDIGIVPIVSEPGTVFDGKIHFSSCSEFDPKNSLVKSSLRPGFMLEADNIVMQKEKIEI